MRPVFFVSGELPSPCLWRLMTATREMKKRHIIPGVIGAWVVWTLAVAAGQLAWHEAQHAKWAELKLPKEGRTGFTHLAPEQTGIQFTNLLDEGSSAANRVLENGSGAAAGDLGPGRRTTLRPRSTGILVGGGLRM